jgi:nicotinamidase-related amidase
MSGLSPDDYPEYAEFAYSHKSRPPLGYGQRPALVLVDVCKAYWTKGSPLDISSYEKGASAPGSMEKLVAAARAGKCPLIWTQSKYIHPDSKDAGLFAKKAKLLDVFLEGDPRGLNRWLENLEPATDEIIIQKKYQSPFFGTNLLTQLHVLDVDTLIICGVSTSGCVRATVLDAMQSGLRPIVSFQGFSLRSRDNDADGLLPQQVVAAACGDRSREVHFSNLFDINAKYGDVVAEEEALEKLKVGW